MLRIGNRLPQRSGPGVIKGSHYDSLAWRHPRKQERCRSYGESNPHLPGYRTLFHMKFIQFGAA